MFSRNANGVRGLGALQPREVRPRMPLALRLNEIDMRIASSKGTPTIMQTVKLFARRLAVALVTLCAAPSAFAQEHTKDSLDMVKKALAEKKAVLIDVREKSEWDAGHLQGAKLLPLSRLKDGALPKELDQLLPKDKIAYLHCAAGGRCLKAAEALRKAGYEVRALKDGYKDLLISGFPKADDKAKEPSSIKVWPGKAPGETKELPPESDLSKPGQGESRSASCKPLATYPFSVIASHGGC